MERSSDALEIRAAGLGETQRRILVRLKRAGRAAVSDLAGPLALSAETVREHLNALAARDLVRRAGARREGPGRPEVVYALAPEAEALFPDEEGRLLRSLVTHLMESGREEVLREFFRERGERLREAARERLAGLEGRERLEEVAAILDEQGFMAEVVDDEEEGSSLRLCHCPIRALVRVSHLPCRSELAWVRDLLGEPLARRTYMPDGDHTCSYRVGEEA